MMKRCLIACALLCALLPSLAAGSPPFRAPPFPITCALVLCPSNTRCIETNRGPQCVPRPFPPPPSPPSSCAVILCIEGTRCVEGAQGASCVPIDNAPVDPVEPTPTPQPPSCEDVQCERGSRCVLAPGGPVCEPVQTPPPDLCACIQIFDPVCCRFADGSVRTAGNSCECTGCNSGNEIVSEGACAPSSCAAVDCAPGFECVVREGIAQCVESESCVCPEIYQPVCCRSANGIETKSNSCFCACEPSGSVLFNRECPTFESH